MMKFGFKKDDRPRGRKRAGLDIGSRSIKILEISDEADRPGLAGLASKDISGLEKKEISDAIKELAESAKITAKDMNIAVSGPAVIVRFVSVPKMRDEELKSAVRFEAEKFIPFNIKDCIIDFQILNKQARESKLHLLLVAAKREYVEGRIKLVEDAGFTVKAVDVDNFALANSFVKNNPTLDPAKAFALVNFGAGITNVSILKGDVISFVRDATIGSRDFTAAISKKMNIDLKSAEELMITPKDKVEQLIDAARGVLGNLMDDVKLSFSYYENQSGGGIDEIYISGGAARLIGLSAAFEELFGSKPSFWNPLSFLDTAPSGINAGELDRASSAFAIAAGLALR